MDSASKWIKQGVLGIDNPKEKSPASNSCLFTSFVDCNWINKYFKSDVLNPVANNFWINFKLKSFIFFCRLSIAFDLLLLFVFVFEWDMVFEFEWKVLAEKDPLIVLQTKSRKKTKIPDFPNIVWLCALDKVI